MDEIEIVPADPAWPALFATEAARLWALLPRPLILDIQHFGSTAVPGLAAKPIIDMLLATPDLAAARAAFAPILQAQGYVFWADNPQTDRLLFIKGLPPSAPGAPTTCMSPNGAAHCGGSWRFATTCAPMRRTQPSTPP